MTAIEFSGAFRERRVRYDYFGAVRAAWRAFIAHRRTRRTLVTLSRLPEHVVRDMGLEPEHIYAALGGTWDEVEPAAYQIHLPKRERI